MGVYVKGNPKEGEYKLIKTTDGFVLEGKDIAYACIEIDLVKCEECEWSNGECSVGERYQGGCTFGKKEKMIWE